MFDVLHENPSTLLYHTERVLFKTRILSDANTRQHLSVDFPAPSSSSTRCSLYVTNFRLILERRTEETDPSIEIPLCSIAEVSGTRPNNKVPSFPELLIACKNFKFVKLSFPDESTDNYEALVTLLQENLLKKDVETLPSSSLNEESWLKNYMSDEFTRLNFKIPTRRSHLGNGFRITTINENGRFCPSYPHQFIVPNSISDGELRKISHFRAQNRIPAVTYRHSNGTVIARCSQPLMGLRRRRCVSDESYMETLLHQTNGKLAFIDCRSQVPQKLL
uniref:Myotubularinlike protein putative n=1 Tax=Albugo laibachii Nc14 TaxID=890382 RepID=F0W6R4_9STRA|nr:myotubularinlike protein putative [Albugo laibachii Nc14]|eukprot:CCA16809.1 myotubularinlike protein putative [Albugo laibachii Nc14]